VRLPSSTRPREPSANPDGGGAFYDQLAWFHEDSHARLTLHNQQRSWRMSDHYPLWAEFSVRGL
jgi:hypothetical protein